MGQKNFLWKYKIDYCYGYVEGLFIATELQINKLVNNTIYFGEIMGKHSEVEIEFENGDFTKIDLDSKTIENITKLLGNTWSGYNPLEFLDDDKENK